MNEQSATERIYAVIERALAAGSQPGSQRAIASAANTSEEETRNSINWMRQSGWLIVTRGHGIYAPNVYSTPDIESRRAKGEDGTDRNGAGNQPQAPVPTSRSSASLLLGSAVAASQSHYEEAQEWRRVIARCPFPQASIKQTLRRLMQVAVDHGTISHDTAFLGTRADLVDSRPTALICNVCGRPYHPQPGDIACAVCIGV